jgi:SAM-dependent methyltransferase
VSPRGAALEMALATFGVLALELALIRWSTGQVRAFAYFNNLVLVAAFLGTGLGVALARRRGGLEHATLPALAVLSAVLAFAEPLGLVRLSFPDPSVHLWGAEGAPGLAILVRSLAIFGALVAAVVTVFVFAGAAVGARFGRLPALAAYRWDLAGSLLGVLSATAVAATGAGPAAWLALGVAPFAWLSRRPLSIAAGAAVVLCGALSVRGAVFSPYNRIDLVTGSGDLRVDVNRDFHQYIHDLSNARVVKDAGLPGLLHLRYAYDLPFVVNDRRGSALVVGAGTGNDVAAALRNRYGRVVSVDIDSRILEIGRRLHPEHPYQDPRVEVVVDDARAFFERRPGAFDAVVFGLLDSHAMFTALSSLRLDNYVYTEQGLRAAWEQVAPGGHLSVSFSTFAGPWIQDRLYWTLARATGREPVAIRHGVHEGCTFLVPREGAKLNLDLPFPRATPATCCDEVRTTSDDWPFLYVRPGSFAWGYAIVIGALLAATAAASGWAFGADALRRELDPALFLMGAGFLLIETRGVTALSLLFGSTWVVNAVVFAGILVLAFLANEVVARTRVRRQGLWFGGLLASVALVAAVPPAALGGLGLLARGVAGGIVAGLPIACAGVLVSMRLARSRDPAAALGSNLLGAVVGGCLEYLSMVFGLRALALLAFALYLAAAVLVLGRPAEGAPAESTTVV